jgi:hypothetical protein
VSTNDDINCMYETERAEVASPYVYGLYKLLIWCNVNAASEVLGHFKFLYICQRQSTTVSDSESHFVSHPLSAARTSRSISGT